MSRRPTFGLIIVSFDDQLVPKYMRFFSITFQLLYVFFFLILSVRLSSLLYHFRPICHLPFSFLSGSNLYTVRPAFTGQ